jgi:hypothetical protein
VVVEDWMFVSLVWGPGEPSLGRLKGFVLDVLLAVGMLSLVVNQESPGVAPEVEFYVAVASNKNGLEIRRLSSTVRT